MHPRALRGSLAALLMSLAPVVAVANPSDPTVVHGNADFSAVGGALEIRNDPGTIIDWGGFSIGAGELARFIQQSADSAVLNRVVGAEASQILGTLASNGRVFLINPNGVVFGDGAVIDTAGFVASTLEMTDADFLAGDLKLAGNGGRIVNAGMLRTRGGNVFFVAPDIENSGIIQAEDGSLTLAAGREVRIASLDEPGVEVLVQAPDDRVLNLGELIAERGAVRALAGTIEHSGAIEASSVSIDADGAIVLRAAGDVTLAEGSRLAASGADGGAIDVVSDTGTVIAAGTIDASGSDGTGGRIRVLGDRVGLVGEAVVDASGSQGGGEILIGGNARGEGPEPNASRAYVGADVTLDASATGQGDGGRLVVYADDDTRVHGTLAARGGADGGDGGFIETSGGTLEVTSTPDAAASAGAPGEWLIDPDVLVVSGNVQTDIATTNLTGETVFTGGEGALDSQIGDTVLEAVIAAGTSLTLDTGAMGQSIIIDSPLDFVANTPGLFVRFDANEGITVNQPIVNTGSSPLDYRFEYNEFFTPASEVVINADLVTGPAGGGTIFFSALEGGDVRLNGPILLDGAVVSEGFGTVNISDPAGPVRITGPATLETLVVDGGSILFEFVDPAGIQFSTTDILTLSAGSVGGPGRLDALFDLDWYGGEFSGSGLTNAVSTATIDLRGPNDLFVAEPLALRDRRLILGGSSTWNEGDITMSGSAELAVFSFLTSNFATPTSIINAGGAPIVSINASGTYGLDGAGLTIEAAVDNDGVLLSSGPLALLGGSGAAGAADPSMGNFDIGSATLQLGGAHFLTGNVSGTTGSLLRQTAGTTVSSAGLMGIQRVEIPDGVFRILNDVVVPVLDISGGTLETDASSFDVTSALNWSGGAVRAIQMTPPNGRLTIGPAATATLTGGTKTLDGPIVLDIQNVATWDAGDLIMSNGAAILVGRPGEMTNIALFEITGPTARSVIDGGGVSPVTGVPSNISISSSGAIGNPHSLISSATAPITIGVPVAVRLTDLQAGSLEVTAGELHLAGGT
ncbi:MAG TPA: filamentous hemagglutinin N-terminal domain-containing protein, partial [Pseudomonadales bacterium]|nr:filamentous hemagglutinin N-terminal domain-containing protein [Pseudomonadales bacterium]